MSRSPATFQIFKNLSSLFSGSKRPETRSKQIFRKFFKSSKNCQLFSWGSERPERFSAFIQLFFRGPDVQRLILNQFSNFPAIFFKSSRIYQLFFGVRPSREILCFYSTLFSGSRRPETHSKPIFEFSRNFFQIFKNLSTLFWGPNVQRNSLFSTKSFLGVQTSRDSF